jgi:predicted Zn finger-like uncharacterized protein
MPALITRCPACATMFKVVPDQLRVSEGWVRCGHCSEVFDASAHLQPPAAVAQAQEQEQEQEQAGPSGAGAAPSAAAPQPDRPDAGPSPVEPPEQRDHAADDDDYDEEPFAAVDSEPASDLSPDSAERTARQAVAIARASAAVGTQPVRLAPLAPGQVQTPIQAVDGIYREFIGKVLGEIVAR